MPLKIHSGRQIERRVHLSRDSHINSLKNITTFTVIDALLFLGDGDKYILNRIIVGMHATLDDH